MTDVALPAGFSWGVSEPAQGPIAPVQPPDPGLEAREAPAASVVTRVPIIRRDLGDLLTERWPDFDPVVAMAAIAQAEDWPKSLRLQALKDVARYTRPLVTPEVGGGDRATILIVDQTREAAARGDVAALRAMNQSVAVAEDDRGPDTGGPVTVDGDAVVIDPALAGESA